MSTTLLYHAFGLKGYHYQGLDVVAGQVFMKVRHDPDALRCPNCASADVLRRGTWPRCFRTIPIGKRSVYLYLPVQRLECLNCGVVRQMDLGFADPRYTYTHAFERYALELSRFMTIKDVAHHLGVSWDTIKEIQKRYLKRRFEKPKLKHLQLIAIDEISIGRGHRYLTVVLDLESGAIVFVGDGKGADALKPFWKRLRGSGARIRAVAIDMSPAYIRAVRKNLRNAVIVFDHFHVVKLFNDKLSDLRRELQREAEDALHKKVLKGTRWLLLKNPENLDEKHDEQKRLDEALRINKPLATAYYLKEDLRLLWSQFDKSEARRFLSDWCARAEVSGIRMLKDFAKTLRIHREGILAWYDFEISTAPLEGTNTKIRVLQRQAYGFRDQDFFKLKIMGLHETKIALVG